MQRLTNKISLNVGYNFDANLPGKLNILNNKYVDNGVCIKEVYGSLSDNKLLRTARPKSRLPSVNLEDLEKHIKLLSTFNIDFNYALNALPTHLYFDYKDCRFVDILKILKNCGVKYITVSNMYLLYKLNEANKKEKIYKEPFIVISTIMEVSQYRIIESLLSGEYSKSIARIILSIYSNRDFPLFYTLNIRNKSNKIELLVNEFCSYKGLPCIYRKSCYEIHSIRHTKPNTYPLKLCSALRAGNPESFLQVPVVFPWSLNYYDKYGISSFKISGRTLPTKFITYVTEAYMSFGEVMDDNLLTLWGHVDKIGSDDLLEMPKINISCKKLSKSTFMCHFNDLRNRCSLVTCVECRHCKIFYDLCKV